MTDLTAHVPPAEGGHERLRELRRHWAVFALGVVLPLAIFLTFVGYPIAYNVYLSFHSWDGLSSVVRSVGLDNYSELIHDRTFWLAFTNTAKWTIGTVFFADVAAFLLAVALRSGQVYFATFLRLLFFLPVMLSLVAVGLMFAFILNPGFGALGQLFQAVGLSNSNPDLLGHSSTAIYALIVIFGWSYLGIALMLFDAGLTQIPRELYESARLEGANAWQRLRFITVPMMRPIFMVVTVFAVLEALRAFDLVLVMTRGGPASASNVLGYFMYVTSFGQQRFGYGAAISTSILLFSGIFAVLYIRRAGREALGGGGE